MFAIIGLVIILLALFAWASVKYTREILSGEDHGDHGTEAAH